MAKPLYREVYERLLDGIRSGVYKPGARLPTNQELGVGFGVSIVTIRHAMQLLEGDGLIQRWPRRGTFVTADLVERIGGGWSGFAADIERERQFIEVVTLRVGSAASSDWGYEVLRGTSGPREITMVRRLHLAKGTPMMCTDHYLPFTLTPDDVEDFAGEVYFWAYLVSRHMILPVRSQAEMRAVEAGNEMGKVFQIPPVTPLLHHRKVFYNGDGHPCECLSAFTRTESWAYRVDANLPSL